ncbi:hypothetical protein H9P43_009457 [Blastocladiella emersonii ATCC 22665]|nr:hypothetical protein H9P43_009457 [Blastocladiella emersonii ATCC 22665]
MKLFLLSLLCLSLASLAAAREITPAEADANLEFSDLSYCLERPASVTRFTSLPKHFEPSDAYYDARRRSLFVVSDDGTLGEFSPDGDLRKSWFVQLPYSTAVLAAADPVVAATERDEGEDRRADLEGCTMIPSRKDVVYLGHEFPPAVLEFSLTHGSVQRVFPLAGAIGIDEDVGGIEALTYVPDPAHPDRGFFFAGRQSDARIFVFQAPIEMSEAQRPKKGDPVPVVPLTYLGAFDPPGPGEDLAALTVVNTQLFAIFDKPQRVVEISLLDPRLVSIMSPPESGTVLTTTRAADLSVDKPTIANTPMRGIEAFAAMRHSIDELVLFLGLDVNKKKTRELYRYDCME